MTVHHERANPAATPRPPSPPYGFDDDDATRRLLRSRPPRRALDWAGCVLGGTVRSTRALRGGMSSAVHLLGVVLPSGHLEQVVLRRYVRPELNEEDPDHAGREAGVLRFVESVDVPAPRLLAVDLRGMEAGVPAVLMSRLPGRIEWSPADLDRWLVRLAELLPVVHEAVLPPAGVLGHFAPYPQKSSAPPEWARWPRVWERAVELVGAPPSNLETRFIHRDFHPGNVLWRRGKVTGLVDWQAACVGPPSADVAHCRANLFRYGLHVADRFTAVWERLTGDKYQPWAEIASIVGFLDALRDDPGSDRFVTEEALARAVIEFGGSP